MNKAKWKNFSKEELEKIVSEVYSFRELAKGLDINKMAVVQYNHYIK